MPHTGSRENLPLKPTKPALCRQICAIALSARDWGQEISKKTGVALLIRHRGHCEPLWAVIPPLQVVLSSACSVASLGRFPSHYLPGHPHLRMGVLADHLFGWGIPSTRQAGHATVHSASSVKSPYGAQGGMTLPNENIMSSVQLEPNNFEIAKKLLGACNGGAQTGALMPKVVPKQHRHPGDGGRTVLFASQISVRHHQATIWCNRPRCNSYRFDCCSLRLKQRRHICRMV